MTNENMAKILLQDVQMHLESNERFIKDFGMQLSYGNWADGQFQTKDNKNFLAKGLNQPFRGLRFGADRIDLAIVDDVEDRDQAKNKDMVRKYGDKIVGDLVKAFHFKRGRLIVPQNYIVKDGINDYILKKFKNSKHLDVSTVNLTDKDGNPSWPERMTKEDTDRINADTDYYTSQREDYNNPIEEGKLFKSHQMIKRKVHGNESWDGFIVHWDLSYTSNGDYKAGVLIGVQGIRMTVLEVFCQRCSINSAMEEHFKWIFKYKIKGYTPLSFYDATAAQLAVYSPIIEQCAEDNQCPDLPIGKHQQGDKHNKIEATVGNALQRKILYWDARLEGDDYEEFMSQVLSFEKGTTGNDDAPDTLCHGILNCQIYYGFSKDQGKSKPVIGKKNKKRRL